MTLRGEQPFRPCSWVGLSSQAPLGVLACSMEGIGSPSSTKRPPKNSEDSNVSGQSDEEGHDQRPQF